jgi:hypothetical protein
MHSLGRLQYPAPFFVLQALRHFTIKFEKHAFQRCFPANVKCSQITRRAIVAAVTTRTFKLVRNSQTLPEVFIRLVQALDLIQWLHGNADRPSADELASFVHNLTVNRHVIEHVDEQVARLHHRLKAYGARAHAKLFGIY